MNITAQHEELSPCEPCMWEIGALAMLTLVAVLHNELASILRSCLRQWRLLPQRSIMTTTTTTTTSSNTKKSHDDLTVTSSGWTSSKPNESDKDEDDNHDDDDDISMSASSLLHDMSLRRRLDSHDKPDLVIASKSDLQASFSTHCCCCSEGEPSSSPERTSPKPKIGVVARQLKEQLKRRRRQQSAGSLVTQSSSRTLIFEKPKQQRGVKRLVSIDSSADRSHNTKGGDYHSTSSGATTRSLSTSRTPERKQRQGMLKISKSDRRILERIHLQGASFNNGEF